MRVLIAGPWRSGTTALYNLVRTICGQHGSVYACFDDQYDAIDAFPGTFDYEVVKVHKYRWDWVLWADKIITIRREPAEVIESMRRFFVAQDEETLQHDRARALYWLAEYNLRADYSAHYNQLSRSTEKLARELAEVIGVGIDEKETVRMFRKIKPPKSGVDPVTLLHENHITK